MRNSLFRGNLNEGNVSEKSSKSNSILTLAIFIIITVLSISLMIGSTLVYAGEITSPVESDSVQYSLQSDSNADSTISIQYYSGQSSDPNPKPLGEPISKVFDSKDKFVWTVQSKTYLGKINEIVVSEESKVYVDVSYTESTITVATKDLDLPSQINISVYTGVAKADYYVEKYLQNLNNSEFSWYSTTTKTGEIGSYVPLEADKTLAGGTLVQESGANINPDGNTHVYLYFTRNFITVDYDLKGGSQGPAVKYKPFGEKTFTNDEIIPVDAEETIWSPSPVPVNLGYSFKGWYLDSDPNHILSKDELLNMTQPAEQLTLKAKWDTPTGKEGDVTILYYGQNAEVSNESEFDDKDYSWIAERYEKAPIDSIYILTDAQMEPRHADGDISIYHDHYPEFFQCGEHSRSQAAKVVDGVQVKADGTSIVKVYLNRNVYKWNFYSEKPESESAEPLDVIEARWGQNISQKFEEICKKQTEGQHEHAPWIYRTTEKPESTDYVSLLLYMDRYMMNDWQNCFYYFNNEEIYLGELRFVIQKLGFEDTHSEDVRSSGPWENYELLATAPVHKGAHPTKEDFISIAGFETPTPGTEDAPAIENPQQYGDQGFTLYYKRHSHSIYLNYIKGDDEEKYYYKQIDNVPYGMKFSDIPVGDTTLGEFAPEQIPGLDENLVFSNWTYDTDRATGIPINLDDELMPDADINIFANWVAPKVKVNFNISTPWQTSSDTEQVEETYNQKITQNIPDVPRDTSGRYVFNSWYYLTDPLGDDVKDNRTYFDPKTMVLPNRDVKLLLEYTDNGLCNYTINYQYVDGQGQVIELAPSTTGVGRQGTDYAFDVFPKASDQLSEEYVGLYSPNENSHHMVLSLMNPDQNTYTFTYKLTGSFSYTVECYDTTTEKVIKTESGTSTTRTITEKYRENLDDAYRLADDESQYKSMVLVADASKNVIRFNYVQNEINLKYMVDVEDSSRAAILKNEDSETFEDGCVYEEVGAFTGIPFGAKVDESKLNQDLEFNYWYVLDSSGQIISGVTSNEISLVPTKDWLKIPDDGHWSQYTFVAKFTFNQFELTYNVNDSSLGSVSPTNEVYGYYLGEPKGTTAIPAEHCIFVNWTDEDGNVVSTDASFNPGRHQEELNIDNESITIDSAIYNANFQIDPEYQKELINVAQTSDNVVAVVLILGLVVVGSALLLIRRRDC